MEQRTFDFLTEIDSATNKRVVKITTKKREARQRGQLGFEFFKTKRKSWPFCGHCRIRRAATSRWQIGHGSALKPAKFKGMPVCKACFGRSEDENPLSIDDFAERRNDVDYDTGGFSWSNDGD